MNGIFKRMAILFVLIALGGCSKSGGDGGTGQSGIAGQGGIGDPGNGDKVGLITNAFLEHEPGSVGFSAGTPETRFIRIKNIGTTGSVTLTAAFMKSGSPQFSVEFPAPVELGPLGYVELEVTFTPSEGASEDVLVIEHNSGFQEFLQIPVFVSSGSGFLDVSPSVLEFEAVLLGTSEVRVVNVENLGTVPTPISSIEFTDDSATDFTLLNEEVPETIAAGEILELSVRYEPDGIGADVAQLRVVGGDANAEFFVLIKGTVSGPVLTSIPGIIDFGFTSIENGAEKTVRIKNVGTAAATLNVVELDSWTDEAVSIVALPELPLVLAPEEDCEVTVAFSPNAEMEQSLNPIGALVAGSEETAPLVTPIYGNPSAPKLFVTPDFLDFGLVASSDTVYRDLTALNTGEETLEVFDITLPSDSNGEFFIDGYEPGNWSPPGVILAGESVKIRLGFTNQGQEGSIASGELLLDSNSSGESTLAVAMEAKRGGQKSCEIEVTPPSLNFAIVPYGLTKTMPVTIKNVGSGPCTYLSTTTYDCDGGLGGLFGGGNCAQGIGGMSSRFKVVAQPPPVPAGIAQGDSVSVQIMFVPPNDAPLLAFFDTYQGAFQVSVTDPSNGNGVVQYPVAAGPDQLSANLIAQSGISDISVIPSTIDFGLVTINCSAPEQKITIYNNGNAPLNVSNISLVDCTPEFEITQLPPFPPEGLEVTQAAPVEFFVSYKPQVPETSFCTVSIQSTDQDQALLTVPMQGTGTFDTEQTDVFTQLSGQMVDILFVVDDSGSMGEEQSNLAANFSALMQEANQWGTDYQMGVITTDIKNDSASGKLQGNPLIVGPGAGAETQFQNNVQVGSKGAGDQEAGLEAANLALSMPLIFGGANTSCAVDADCASLGEGLSCTGGTCMGWNGGFLRDDAALEVVFVSDEEDQSPGPLNFYIDFLKSIKGFANEGLMHAHAIVGDANSGCSSSNGDAGAGDRYIEVANQTGGKVGSICDDNFASVLSSIGEVAFGLKVQFFLSANAEPGTVQVTVDGTVCNSGWEFDEDSNSVIFDSNGSCMPEEGDTISIYYKMLCLP